MNEIIFTNLAWYTNSIKRFLPANRGMRDVTIRDDDCDNDQVVVKEIRRTVFDLRYVDVRDALFLCFARKYHRTKPIVVSSL
jgi:hypothetical protein